MINVQKKFGYKKGFGILEVLISIVIIVIILSSVILISRAAMNNSTYIQERAKAIYLGQEGIELVRQIRDTNWIDSRPDTKWNILNLNDGLLIGNKNEKLKISYDDNLIPTNPNKYRYELVATGGLLEQIEVGGTTFSREVVIDDFRDDKTRADAILPDGSGTSNLKDSAIKVTVLVTWNYNGSSKKIEVSEVLTDWRPSF